MSDRDAYEKKVQEHLDQWQVELDKMRSHAERAQADVKDALFHQIDVLQEQQHQAVTNFREMLRHSDESWHQLQAQTEAAWNDVAEGMKKAWERFR